MTGCPEQANTEAFVLGQDGSQDGVLRHIKSCAQCKAIVDRASSSATIQVGGGMTVTAPERASRDSIPPPAAPRQLGRYRMLEELGAGGMGAVFAAEDQDLDRRVAIKLLHGNSASVARLLREARALAKLRHPNVVTVYEVGREGLDSYVVMELVEGITLRAWLRGEHSLEERTSALVGAGRGLAAAHAEGLVHRDFKPENVMVGKTGRVQVLDFGLATDAKDVGESDDEPAPRASGTIDRLTMTGTVLGTPAYMAPEQFAAAAIDARTDQFAFCIVLFEALHGFRPFEGDTFEQLKDAASTGKLIDRPLAAGVPPAVQAAIARGLSVEPAARFPTMDALLATLTQPPRRPRGTRVLAISATAAVLATAGVWIATRHHDEHPPPPPPAVDPVQAILASSHLPELVPVAAADDPYKLTVHRLSNGLTVWISPNHKSPRIQASFVVRSGSRVETGQTGLAHILAHIMYAGSEQIGTKDFAAEAPHLNVLRELYARRARSTSDAERATLLDQIDKETQVASRFTISSELNRTMQALGVRDYTGRMSADSGRFLADLPSNRLEQWAQLEGDHWAAPVFRSFHAEIGAIFDEIVNLDEGAQPGEVLQHELYPGHPYGHAQVGAIADIVSEPFTAVSEFFTTWYVPNNAALMLAGDIDAATAIPILERQFAAWRPRALPADTLPLPPRLAAASERTIDGALLYAQLGWRTVGSSDPDAVAVSALAALARQLSIAKTDRAQIELGTVSMRDGGAIVAALLPASGHSIDDGIAALDEVLDAVRTGRFSDDLLDAVLRNERADNELTHDDNMTRVLQMEMAYTSGQSWAQVLSARDAIAKLTRADLLRVAAKYLIAKRVVVKTNGKHYDAPKIARGRISPLEPDQSAQSKLAAKVLGEESVDIPPRFVSAGRDYQLQPLATGPLLTVLDPKSKTYELRMSWDLGARQLPLICLAVRALVLGGLTDGDLQARRARWYGRVMSVDVKCDLDTVEFDMKGNDATFATDWQEMQTWLEGNGISALSLSTAAQTYLAERSQWDQSGMAWLVAQYAEHGSTDILPRSQVEQAGSEAVRVALRALLATRRVTSYIGPRTELHLRLPALAVHAPQAVVRKRVHPTIAMLDTGPNTPINVSIRVPLGKIDRHRAALMKLDAEYLATSGSGRLFDALHGGQSTSYIVQAVADTEIASDAHLELWFGSTADQVAKSLTLALSIMRDRNIDAGYFSRARGSLEQRYRADWITDRELPTRVTAWLRAGFTGDPRQQDFDDIQRASSDVLATLIADIAAAPPYISISGDLSAIDRAQLAPFGTVETVTMAQLVH